MMLLDGPGHGDGTVRAGLEVRSRSNPAGLRGRRGGSEVGICCLAVGASVPVEVQRAAGPGGRGKALASSPAGCRTLTLAKPACGLVHTGMSGGVHHNEWWPAEGTDLVRGEPGVDKVASDADGDLPPDGGPQPQWASRSRHRSVAAHALVPEEEGFKVRHSISSAASRKLVRKLTQ